MFKNRLDAAKQLAEKLKQDKIKPTKIVGLTKGGQKMAQYIQKLLPPTTNHPSASSAQSNCGRGQNQITILIVDDGSISLEKLIHAIKLYRRKNIKRIILGLPVYKHEEIRKLEKLADAVYTINEPKTFISAEEFYHDL